MILFLYNFTPSVLLHCLKLGLTNNIKKSIAEIVVGIWPLSEHKPTGKHINTREGKTVFVFSFSSEEELSVIKTFVTSSKQYCDICEVVAFSREIKTIIPKDDTSIFYISQNDFNLFGRIKDRFEDWLINNNFNLLISFVSESELFCDKIISNINSDFKAGNFDQGNVNLFDLTLKHETDNFTEQFEQISHYIDKLNINR